MDKEIQEQWYKALLSDQYTQGFRRLKRGPCFCATGVLADLYVKTHPDSGIKWTVDWDGECALMGKEPELLWWAGLPQEVLDWSGLSPVQSSMIADANDKGVTFKEIAERVKELV